MSRLGITAALAAFIFWGLVPIYFKGLVSVPPLEVIGHRILWSIPVLLLFLRIRDGARFWQRLALPWRQLAMLGVTGVLVAFNWLVFVWAVVNDQVLATSLGYFINPLVNVLLGILFLRERLTRIQRLAVVIAALGTVFLAVYLGQPPWVSLMLAFSFGFYGLLRKQLAVGPMLGLLWETLLLGGIAVIYLAWFASPAAGFQADWLVNTLLLLSGLITILPLIWYNVAAKELPLSTVGYFQYLAPTISFLLAVYLFGEPFTLGHKVAFAAIWLALAMISLEPWLRGRRRRAV